MDDGGSPTTGMIIMIVLLVMDAIVFGFLAAMQNLNEASVEKLSKEGNKKAGLLLQYLDKKSRYAHICQLIMLTVHMLMGFILVPLWKNYFFSNEGALWISTLQSILVFVCLMIIMLVFGIFIPEKIASRKAEAWGLSLVMVFHSVEVIFFPLVFVMDTVANLIAKLFGIDPLKDLDDVTEEEIISMVNEGHEQGVLLASEAEMIHNIFEFGDKEAKDIMTHRKNIIALDGSMTFLETLSILKENNYSRYPVYLEDIDNIIGVLHIKEALALSQEHSLFEKSIKEIDELIRDVEVIPETRNINTLFTMMQSEKSHMVVVVDEYGQTSGIVAMEDILEEIVGNIEDEHDEEKLLIERMFDGSFVMSGMTPLEDALEALGVELEDEEDEFETLNGFLISLIGKIPTADETFFAEAYGYLFEVLSIENKMIQSVKITKAPERTILCEDDSCQNDEMVVE